MSEIEHQRRVDDGTIVECGSGPQTIALVTCGSRRNFHDALSADAERATAVRSALNALSLTSRMKNKLIPNLVALASKQFEHPTALVDAILEVMNDYSPVDQRRLDNHHLWANIERAVTVTYYAHMPTDWKQRRSA